VAIVLTCVALKRWGIDYYNRTAREATQAAKAAERGGGLGEYYAENETRVPTWMVVGDAHTAATLVGLTDEQRAGGHADLDTVTRWLEDGIAPNGAHGRAFAEGDNRGFDVTICAPKSVSLLRAYGDDVTHKAVQDAHAIAMKEALESLADHAGYTRVHNKVTGKKDLQRLPGLVVVAYQHETSRAGDPHLHTHVIVPNKQARADGKLGAIDSDQLWHESKAAGVIYQATLRRELTRSLGVEWQPVDPHTGMAELVGIDPDVLKAHSTRSTQLREWADGHLVLVDGKPTAAQLATAQKATRPRKPEGISWAELRAQWHADPRGYRVDQDAIEAARRERQQTLGVLSPADVQAAAAAIDKAAFTRADLVEIIGAQLPIEVDGDDRSPREQIEAAVDLVGVRISEARQPHHREGYERYTLDVILAQEHRLFRLADTRIAGDVDLAVTTEDTAGLSADQARAVTAIAESPWLIQPLTAPAGAGKTHSLKALRSAAHRAGRGVVVVSPHGRAVDVAVGECAGDTGYTVDAALAALNAGWLTLDASTVVVIDEAGLAGDQQLLRLLRTTTESGAKTVLVGDPHQLAPVRKRGGMFDQLSVDLPWSQRLSEVWRMRDREERTASLALRNGGAAPLRKAVEWYRRHDRLRCGDQVTMGADALAAYRADVAAGKDALLAPDSWELCDSLNTQLHNERTGDSPTVTGARDQQIGRGDIIVSRRNDTNVMVVYCDEHGRPDENRPAPQVRNGQRWEVRTVTVDDRGRQGLLARRLDDDALAVFHGAYLREHVHLGYAVTLQSVQGVTADTSYPILSEGTNRNLLYLGLTRGREINRAFIYDKIAGEQDHEHGESVPGIREARRGDSRQAATLVRAITGRDTRPHSAHQVASDTDRSQLDSRLQASLAAQARDTGRRRREHRAWLTQRAEDQRAAEQLAQMQVELAMLRAAGNMRIERGFNPGTHLAGLPQSAGDAITTAARSGYAATPIRTGTDADATYTAMRALHAAAAVKGQRVVWSAPRQDWRDEAQEAGVADEYPTPKDLYRHLGQLAAEHQPGQARPDHHQILIVVDHAEAVRPANLLALTQRTAAVNTRLVLLDRGGDGPSAPLLDLLHADLPWAASLTTDQAPHRRPSALDAAADNRTPDPTAAEALTQRATLRRGHQRNAESVASIWQRIVEVRDRPRRERDQGDYLGL
jgi:conjugative relaxase-like TrwC/TraI family protein